MFKKVDRLENVFKAGGKDNCKRYHYAAMISDLPFTQIKAKFCSSQDGQIKLLLVTVAEGNIINNNRYRQKIS